MNTVEARKRDMYIIQARLEGLSYSAIARGLGMRKKFHPTYVRQLFHAAIQRRAPKLYEEGRNADGDENTIRPNHPSQEWLQANADKLLDACAFIADNPTYYVSACRSITE